MKNKRLKIRKKFIAIIILIILIIVGIITIFILKNNSSNNLIIAIDAGHDNTNPGFSSYINEYEYTSALAKKINELFANDNNYKVIYTHDEETDMTINQRANLIEENNATLVITIHASASSDINASGAHLVIEPKNSEYYDDTKKVAEAINSHLDNSASICNEYYALNDDGSYSIQYIDITDNNEYDYETVELMEKLNIPVIQFEGIYVTSQSDVETGMTEEALTNTAKAIYQGIKDIYGK